MSPQRRTALVSVGAAVALMGIKLGTGLASSSLGLDLRGAALGHRPRRRAAHVLRDRRRRAGRPTGRTPTATARRSTSRRSPRRACCCSSASRSARSPSRGSPAGSRSRRRPPGGCSPRSRVVIVIDISRTVVSLRAARRFTSPALASNALHFGSDLAGTLAVLGGLLAVRAGWPGGRLGGGAVRRVPRRHRGRRA